MDGVFRLTDLMALGGAAATLTLSISDTRPVNKGIIL